MSKDDGMFAWREDGSYGLEVHTEERGNFSHEVMYEDEILQVRERPLYLGDTLPRRRFERAIFAVGLLIALLIGRAFWMQVISHGMYIRLAENNRLRQEAIQPKRGIIRDRQGIMLADNVPAFDVAVTPLDLPSESERRKEILGRVSRVTGVALAELEQDIAGVKTPSLKMILARDIPYEQAVALRISLADVPGISIEAGQKRRYPLSTAYPSFSHILGYTGKVSVKDLENAGPGIYRSTDMLGKTGVEAWYEKELRGLPGERVNEVDSFGRMQRTVSEDQPTPGRDLILTLSSKLQTKTEEALRQGLEKAKITRGSVVVIDPRDGAILAIASLPSYDDNIFSGQVSSTAYKAYTEDKDNPFLARAWAGLFPSGSTIKPVYAVALLAEGVITPHTTVLSVGGIRIGAQFFPDWAAGGHGLTDVRKAIAWSVNTFFYITCGGHDGFKGLGAEHMAVWLRKFGFGSRLGLDIPGEVAGLVPSPEWKQKERNEKWYVGDTYNLAIGQGDLLVTPLQIAVATAQIANGGKRLVPHVAFEAATGTKSGETEPLAKKDVIQVVRSGMRDTVVYGSGRALADMPFPVAGKTGTAQWRRDRANHAWFTAFGPYDNPKVAVTVLLEEGVEGSSTAVPIAKQILNEWYKLSQQGEFGN
jgi:penicillin-binding protein 2